MTPRERFLAACARQPVDRSPVWLMRQAGRYLPEYRALKEQHGFLKLVRTPELAAEVTLQPLRRFPLDAAIIFSDILIIAEALGQPYHFRDQGGIGLDYALDSAARIEALQTEGVAARLDYLAQALRLVRKELGAKTTLLGFAGAPWTLAAYMVEGGSPTEHPAVLRLAQTEPKLFGDLMKKLAQAVAASLNMQIAAGADAVQIFDSWGAFCPDEHYADWSLRWVREIISALPPQTPVILFAKGMARHARELQATGARVLSLDWTVDLAAFRAAHPDIATQGNLDPALLEGDTEPLRLATRELLRATAGAGHIVNLGHGITPKARIENVAALVETVVSAGTVATPRMKRLLVIGGGLAGLSAAWHAQRAGVEVRLVEISDKVGGVVQTRQENGYLAESGPNSMLVSTPATAQLLRDLGLENEIVETSPVAKKRFVVRNGALVPVPMSPWQFLATPLFSLNAKIRLLREPWAPHRAPNASGEESLADFARRRLGPEALTYALDPFVAGVYAGNPEKLSTRHAFPRLQALEEKHGSLARAAWTLARERKKAGSTKPKSRSISFHKGMVALPRALAQKLGKAITLQAQLTSLQRLPDGTWGASWKIPAAQLSERFDAVVLAVPALKIADLPLAPAVLAKLAPLTKIEHPPVSVVTLGYARAAVGHPLDGFGVLVPAVEPFEVLGVLFTSSLFPERAPAGHVILTAFVGGARHPELAALADNELLALATRNLEKLLAICGAPTYQRITRWPRAIPQYDLDYGDKLAAIEAAEQKFSGLALAGSYRGGVSVVQCLETGRAAALRALNLSPSVAE